MELGKWDRKEGRAPRAGNETGHPLAPPHADDALGLARARVLREGIHTEVACVHSPLEAVVAARRRRETKNTARMQALRLGA